MPIRAAHQAPFKPFTPPTPLQHLLRRLADCARHAKYLEAQLQGAIDMTAARLAKDRKKEDAAHRLLPRGTRAIAVSEAAARRAVEDECFAASVAREREGNDRIICEMESAARASFARDS